LYFERRVRPIGLEVHLAVVWFLTIAPSTAVLAYGGRRVLRRFRGESDGEGG